MRSRRFVWPTCAPRPHLTLATAFGFGGSDSLPNWIVTDGSLSDFDWEHMQDAVALLGDCFQPSVAKGAREECVSSVYFLVRRYRIVLVLRDSLPSNAVAVPLNYSFRAEDELRAPQRIVSHPESRHGIVVLFVRV